jgi:hypothetical protein
MVGATSTTDGTKGTPPAPLKGQEKHVLRGSGQWEKETVQKLYNSADSYLTGEKVILTGGYLIQANAAIPENTAFAWGTTGATWSLILPSWQNFTFKGVYSPTATYALSDVVAESSASLYLYTPVIAGSGKALTDTTGWKQYHPTVDIKPAQSGTGTVNNITNVYGSQAWLLAKAYAAADVAIIYGIPVEANAAIPANTAFKWGTTGATWKPVLNAGEGLVWKGVWAKGNAGLVGDLVCLADNSPYLYTCVAPVTAGQVDLTNTDFWMGFCATVKPGGFSVSPFTYPTATVAGKKGLVPGAEITDIAKWLSAQGWADLPLYVASTASVAGKAGLIPAASFSQRGYFWRGDGVWVELANHKGATDTVDGVAGFTPAATSAQRAMFYRGDGVWADVPAPSVPVYKGATGTANGTAGLVPVALIAQKDMFLKGDGTYGMPTVSVAAADAVAPLYDPAKAYSARALVTDADGKLYIANGAVPANTPWQTGVTGATWRAVDAMSALLTGVDVASAGQNTEIASGDSLLGALGKLQKQLTTIKPNGGATIAYTGSSTKFSAEFTNAVEKVNIVTTALAAGANVINYEFATQSVMYHAASPTSDFTINFRMSTTGSLDAALAIGQAVTCTLMVTQGATPYKPTVFQVDGVAATAKWPDGIAPTGNASALDVFGFTIVRTAQRTFVIIADLASYK